MQEEQKITNKDVKEMFDSLTQEQKLAVLYLVEAAAETGKLAREQEKKNEEEN